MQIGAIILAGGRSRRMGKPKESLPIGDNTLLGRTSEVLLDCAFPVVVVARSPEQELPPLPLEVDVVFDDQPEQGPLRALCAGIRHVNGRCDAVFATGCDAPFLTAGAISWLADQLGEHDLIMPRVGSVLQPLCAIYRCRILARVEELLASGARKPRTLAEELHARILCEEDLREFDPFLRLPRSVNTPEDYEAMLREVDSDDLS